MENNFELQLASQYVEQTDINLFLTGKAGTGKTTFLKNLRLRSSKRMVVVAPTGIAAINAGGVTIHSFFQLNFGPFIPDSSYKAASQHYRFSREKRNIINSLDLLVIDEISMVRSDLLDAIDAVLRRFRQRDKPFGGVQLLLIGDLQQLAPVVKDNEWNILSRYYASPYFFDSLALKQTPYVTVELKEVFRQTDSHFISLLNKIRENKVDAQTLSELNRRCIPNFVPPKEGGYIRLATHNYQAQLINEHELGLLPDRTFSFTAEIEGNFPEGSFPAEKTLTVKRAAQIMFIKNDSSQDKKYYNGMIGEIISVDEKGIIVCGKDSHQAFNLTLEEWDNTKYTIDSETREITEKIEGKFRQYPIRLAWAITIHKSQGLTFEHAIIDTKNSFAHGQTYVALSRCKTLEGMVLESPLQQDAIISDELIDSFTQKVEENMPDKKTLDSAREMYYTRLLDELFDFKVEEQSYKGLLRTIDQYLYNLYPLLLEQFRSKMAVFKNQLMDVSAKFKVQYITMIMGTDDYENDENLQNRIHSAANYFSEIFLPVVRMVYDVSLDIDNRTVYKEFLDRRMTFLEQALLKGALLSRFKVLRFDVASFLEQRAKLLLEIQGENYLLIPHILLSNEDFNPGGATGELENAVASEKNELGINAKTKSVRKRADGEKKEKRTRKAKVEVPTDILYPELYEELHQWRTDKAKELKMPSYVILKQKALMGIVNLLPMDAQQLKDVPYFGVKGVEYYGLEILSMIRKFKEKLEK